MTSSFSVAVSETGGTVGIDEGGLLESVADEVLFEVDVVVFDRNAPTLPLSPGRR